MFSLKTKRLTLRDLLAIELSGEAIGWIGIGEVSSEEKKNSVHLFH